MVWLPLSLIAAFASATSDALTKRYLGSLNAFETAAVRLAYTLPWLIGGLCFIDSPRLDKTFFIAIACSIPLDLIAMIFYMRAIRISPLSLTLPFLAFTPAFLILSGRIILGERIGLVGTTGIGLIVLGSYCLNIQDIKKGLLAPLRSIIKEPGSRLMLLVSFIYSITSSIGKLGILHSSPAFFGIAYFTSLSLFMLFIMPFMPAIRLRSIVSRPYPSACVGLAYAVMIFSHMTAISMVTAAYMIAVKRTSLLFGVLYGAVLFRESSIPQRLAGAAIMVCGVLVIGFFG